MVVQEFNHIPLLNFLCPQVGGNVNHCAEQFKQQVSVLVCLLGQFNVSVHVLLKGINGLRVELSHVPAYFEQQSISELEGPFYQTFVLIVLGNNLSIARVSCQVHCQSH